MCAYFRYKLPVATASVLVAAGPQLHPQFPTFSHSEGKIFTMSKSHVLFKNSSGFLLPRKPFSELLASLVPTKYMAD